MGKRPTCDTPGRGRPIPVGGEGHPEICPKCLRDEVLNNAVNPSHYRSSPSGVEAIDVIEHMPFNVGTAVKYLWRLGLKDDPIQELKKSIWYLQREISKREREAGK